MSLCASKACFAALVYKQSPHCTYLCTAWCTAATGYYRKYLSALHEY